MIIIKSEYLIASHPYANAIFARARETNTFDRWLDALHTLSVIAADKNFVSLISNPQLSKSQILAVFSQCLAEQNTEVENLLKLLQINQRLILLPAIYVLFKQMLAKLRKSTEATIYSAYELTTAIKQQLEAKLSARFSKTVTTKVVVDTQLIGGIKIMIDDLVLDNSVQHKLTNLAHVALLGSSVP